MAEGNGIDLGSIYGLLLEVAKTVSRHDAMSPSLQGQLSFCRRHGILISDLEDRVRRIESHLDLPPHVSG